MALEMKYFVLKPKGASPYSKASRDAMIAYAESIKADDPELAAQLWRWVDSELDALTPDWIPLTEQVPANGELVEVMSEGWTAPKWLKFDATTKRLWDISTTIHFWYPERMKWRRL